MNTCDGCAFARTLGLGCCNACYMARPAVVAVAVRRSRRLAAKPLRRYTELSEEAQDRLDRRGGLTWLQFVRTVRSECDCTWDEALQEASRRQNGAAPRSAAAFEAGRLQRLAARAAAVQVRATAAVKRQDETKCRRVERILARLEQDMEVFAAMPATPPRLQRHNAVTGEAPWAPPHGPALSRTEATGCELPPTPNWAMFEPAPGALLPPPPLRRVCASPDCDEDCRRCRYNDRLAEFNRGRSPPSPPASVPNLFALPPSSSAGGLVPPPVGATVIRVPIDMAQMTAAALQELIAAAKRALNSK